MIVVVGRPGLSTAGRLGLPAARVALAAAETGARVELVGSVGDDTDGEQVVLELGRQRIGHAALLRDPAAATPHENSDAEEEESGAAGGPVPHLDAADVALGLSYLADCQVLVVAEPLSPAALAAASEAAAYHGAALVVVGADDAADANLPADATVLGRPDGDAAAFSRLVGLYAAQLEAGQQPADAWQEALANSGWEPAAE